MNELDEHSFPTAGYALLVDAQKREWHTDWFEYSPPHGWWLRFVHLMPNGGKLRYWNVASDDPGEWAADRLLESLRSAYLLGLTSKAEVLHQALTGRQDQP